MNSVHGLKRNVGRKFGCPESIVIDFANDADAESFCIQEVFPMYVRVDSEIHRCLQDFDQLNRFPTIRETLKSVHRLAMGHAHSDAHI